MLINVARVVVSRWKVLLQVVLDVMLDAKPIDHFQDAMGVTFPIGGVGHGQVVGPTDFVKVNKFMGAFDNLKTAFSVQGWFQRHPGKDTSIVKRLECRNAVARKLSATFPLATKVVVESGQGRRKGVLARAKNVKVAQRSTSAFGQRADAEAITLQRGQHVTGKTVVARVIGVSGKRQHNLLGNPKRLILVGIFAQGIKKTITGKRTSVEGGAIHLENLWHVAVCAGVTATPIGICRKLGIFASLTTGGVNNGAAFNAPSVVFELVGFAGADS